MIVTIAERRAREAARIVAAAADVAVELRDYAALAGGRFLIFGSAARGDLHYDSDIDIAVDFPTERERAARGFAEDACRRHRLRPDIHLLSEVSPALAARISGQSLELR